MGEAILSVYAQLGDLAAWSGQPIAPDQASRLQFLLNEAEVELEVVAGTLADRITAGLTTTARVTLAVVGMVGAVMRNESLAALLLPDAPSDAGTRMVRWLRVTRRERWLVGMSTRGGSLDLSTRDPQLVRPVRRPPLRRWYSW